MRSFEQKLVKVDYEMISNVLEHPVFLVLWKK